MKTASDRGSCLSQRNALSRRYRILAAIAGIAGLTAIIATMAIHLLKYEHIGVKPSAAEPQLVPSGGPIQQNSELPHGKTEPDMSLPPPKAPDAALLELEGIQINALAKRYGDLFEPQIRPLEIRQPVSLSLDPVRLPKVKYQVVTENNSWRIFGDEQTIFGPTTDPMVFSMRRAFSWGLALVLDKNATWGDSDSGGRLTIGIMPGSKTSDSVSLQATVLASDADPAWAYQHGPGGSMSARPDNPVITIGSYTVPVLPTESATAGSRWNTQGVSPGPNEAYYELTGFASVDGVSCAEIHSRRTAPPEGQDMVPIEQTLYLSLEDGMLEFAKVELPEYQRLGKSYASRLLVRRSRQ